MNYFESENHKNALKNVIDSWRGTPHWHLKAVKKRGVDCSLLVGKCLEEIGVLQKIDFEFIHPDWPTCSHNQFMMNTYVKNLDTNMFPGIGYNHFVYAPNMKLVYGDILIFAMLKNSKSKAHSAIYIGDNLFVQAIQYRTVGDMVLGKYFLDRITDVFRIVEE